MPARYLIGIDLGTTNSAVAYVDTEAADPRVRVFEVPQLVAPGEAAPRRQLPSFVYLAGEVDLAPHETALPWRPVAKQDRDPQAATSTALRPVVGELARTQGARMASRMIASAKSWLCHPGVDRHAAILPWGEGDGPRLSPVAAQALILGHIREAWEFEHPDAPFAEQEVLVTVPASFDEAARELTLQAAAKAGYPPVVLLEEPQAAFYAWIDQARGQRNLSAGERVLVFDVGGGTTDFTLIEVDPGGDGFTRTAVGDHLLLGGDNLDLTLAKIVEQRLVARTSKKLDALQWHALVHACRLAKETLLGDDPPDAAPIVVTSRGAKLIGGTLRDEVTRSELAAVLFDGFFPLVAADAPLARGRGGLQEFGLPYAADPAVTRHLATFLARHGATRVDAILFNGGAMTPASLRGRVIEQIGRWQGTPPRELPATMPEMAVAQGAAYYGLVRRGLATRIKGGTPRAFYIGVETTAKERLAVCLAPSGLDDGARVQLDRDFRLVINRPVSFRLYSSSSRGDQPGALVPVGDGRPETVEDGSDLLELPPIVTALRARGRGGEISVRLEVHITELGALEISCVDHTLARDHSAAPPETWKLAFDMRSGGAAPAAEETADAAPHPRTDEAKAKIQAAFREPAAGQSLATLVKDLETLLEARRDDWSMMTARALFDALVEVAAERKKTPDHEQRWLNLAGFLLRPGTGAPLDTWRARVMWGVFNENLAHPRSEPGKLAWWIVWRRIAGGLVKGQQEQIYDRLGQLLLPSNKQQKKLAEYKPSKQELAEMWRVVASLERVPVAQKLRLGDEVMRRMESRKGREDSVHLWALSRVGARVPLYGPLNAVVPASKVADWLRSLLAWDWPESDKVAFPLAQLGRRTGDRARDLDDATRGKLAAYVRALPGGDRAAVLVEQVVALEAREERVALGDTLPAGLRLVIDDERPADVDG
ncbi:MAG: hsp70 family protein [Deltaproteobacteria bacterium]|nr:hsp70 family protein [Deltaproteobacteria bacterium]MCW5807737.1 hsp70 family protein [Deltaproteobacteria bacterium]